MTAEQDRPAAHADGGRGANRGRGAPPGVEEPLAPVSEGYPEEAWEGAGRPLFLHPPWTVGVVLVFAVVTLLIGLGGHPVWLLIGSPFILVLALWVWARVAAVATRGRDASDDRP